MSLSPKRLRRLFGAAQNAHRRGKLEIAIDGYRRIFAQSKELNRFLAAVGENLSAEDTHRLGLSLQGTLRRLDPVYGAALHYSAIAARQLYASLREAGTTTAEKLALIERTADRLMGLSIIVSPTNPAAVYNFAMAQQQKGNLLAARDLYRQAARFGPEDPHTWAKLGDCLMDLGQVDDGLAAWKRALLYEPHGKDTEYNLSFLYLMLGDWERGLQLHEARWQCPDFVHANGRPGLRAPFVERDQSLAGARVLIRHEQGNGDQIQMGRFVPEIVQRGAIVILEVQQGLVSLFRACYPDLTVIGLGDEIPPHDYQLPWMSLPWFCMRTDEGPVVPMEIPPLPASGKLEAVREQLRGRPGVRVGICWAGSTKHSGDRKRSAPREFLEVLADAPDVTWVNLQVGERSDEFATLGSNRINPVRALEDFRDTAALMQSLDLVICVDTAVAHLAGSVGVLTWLALPFNAEWRWMRDTDHSPWYQSMGLFRQPAPGDWRSVAHTMRECLPYMLRSAA